MNTSDDARKPYHSEMTRWWWLKQRYYRCYMLREATVLPLLFFLGCLLYGLYSLQQGATQWLAFSQFMQQGWVIALNTLALIASLYHAKTFFALFPRVMPLAPPLLMVAGQWLASLAVIITLLWLAGVRL